MYHPTEGGVYQSPAGVRGAFAGEIATRLHYRSLSHLSKQFKAVTGYSPSEYRKLQIMNRLPLDQVS
ncbi:helix-turn-helix domain-containing protein [Rufibacter sp. LB8]|uniref:helix-turn-helix domain-containing protein n=1 Tax=Rufibacter sp. LB8 TaxID=2777781 RepID=UPI00351C5D4C